MPYTAGVDIHPLLWGLFIEWCRRVGADPDVWLARMKREAPTPAGAARVLSSAYGIPESTWVIEPDLAPAVHTEPGMDQAEVAPRRGRKLKNPNTPLGPFMLATGESYASIGRKLKIPYQTIQFYDQGRRTPPEDFPHRVEKFTEGFGDGEHRVPASAWRRRK